ncbi:MAG: hypothetical protein IJY87_02185 [Bacilli bacterium]|nr:hypothetical protein [Bacilli bacterium]
MILVIGNLIFLVWSVILENENIFVIIIIIIMEIVILGNSFIEIEKKKHKRLNNTV